MIKYTEKNLLPAPSRREIMRYMGCREEKTEINELIDSCISESENIFSYKVAYTELPLEISNDTVKIGSIITDSRDLGKCLLKCDKAIIFAATVGLGIDRFIMKYSRTNPSRALCLQAIGAERIEALCNAFCLEIEKKAKKNKESIRPRFSPGYGDLPLELQRDIFKLLDCERRIGLTLNDSLIMSPTKSVTAIIGIYKNKGKNESA